MRGWSLTHANATVIVGLMKPSPSVQKVGEKRLAGHRQCDLKTASTDR